MVILFIREIKGYLLKTEMTYELLEKLQDCNELEFCQYKQGTYPLQDWSIQMKAMK